MNILRITVGVIIMLSAYAVINDDQPWIYEPLLFLLGFNIAYYPKTKKIFSKLRKASAVILIFSLVSLSSSKAQEYSTQVDAFAESFQKKSTASISSHLSPDLKFDPLPASNTSPILTNIVSKLPKLIDLTIVKAEEGKVLLAYDFVGLGKRESSMHFDADGKIIRIELVENLIREEMEAQQKMKESIQVPEPSLSEKAFAPVLVEFDSKDGLKISGQLYETDNSNPIILLCHQAGYNSQEYIDIAPKLNALGYSCLAIDQRSGGEFAGKPNFTYQRAAEKGVSTDYYDALQDIQASVSYLKHRFDRKIILWGSSYSSSLVLIESLNNKNILGSISFSPGDYFGNKAVSLSTVFSDLKKPFFVTSSKQEASTLLSLMGNMLKKKNQIHFVPQSEGFHGSKALWNNQKGAEEYWTAIKDFLEFIKF